MGKDVQTREHAEHCRGSAVRDFERGVALIGQKQDDRGRALSSFYMKALFRELQKPSPLESVIRVSRLHETVKEVTGKNTDRKALTVKWRRYDQANHV